jgi:hypothetical protein
MEPDAFADRTAGAGEGDAVGARSRAFRRPGAGDRECGVASVPIEVAVGLPLVRAFGADARFVERELGIAGVAADGVDPHQAAVTRVVEDVDGVAGHDVAAGLR